MRDDKRRRSPHLLGRGERDDPSQIPSAERPTSPLEEGQMPAPSRMTEEERRRKKEQGGGNL